MQLRHVRGVILLAMVTAFGAACAEASVEVEADTTPEQVVRPVGTDLTGVEIDVHQAVG